MKRILLMTTLALLAPGAAAYLSPPPDLGAIVTVPEEIGVDGVVCVSTTRPDVAPGSGCDPIVCVYDVTDPKTQICVSLGLA